jgi:hypothetical protein
MHKTSSRRRRRGDVTPRVDDDDDDDDDDHIASTAERSVRIFRPRLDAEWRGEGIRHDGGDERVRRSRARGFIIVTIVLVLDGADARVRQGGVDRDKPRPIVRVRVARGTLDVDVGGGEESAQRGH